MGQSDQAGAATGSALCVLALIAVDKCLRLPTGGLTSPARRWRRPNPVVEKRLRGYRAIDYARGEAPLEYSESTDETTVEYDEDVIAELDRNDDFA